MKNKKTCFKKSLRMMACLGVSVSMLWNAEVPVLAETSNEINVEYRTEKEIRKFIQEHPVRYLKADYVIEPSCNAPYAEGQLKEEVLQDGLNMMNQVRYIAGLDADVTLNTSFQIKYISSETVIVNASYTEFAQAAALVNAVNGRLSHSPDKPEGMDESLYLKGYLGAGRSNIAYGYSTLASAILKGWVHDSDLSNIDRVGHRRWILNPIMKETGFGDVKKTDYLHYYAMYAFDGAYDKKGTTEQVSVWPGLNTPTEYFDGTVAWSYSTGNEEDMSKVKVVLENETKGKKWEFSNSSADGYFNVQNDNYGLRGCIIFRPTGITAYEKGDVYKVTITGLYSGRVLDDTGTVSGNNTYIGQKNYKNLYEGAVSYHVSFFSLEDAPKVLIRFDANGATGSMTPVSVEEGKDYVLPGCGFYAPAGKLFDHWELDGTAYKAGQTIAVEEERTLVAIWKDKQYAGKGDANGDGEVNRADRMYLARAIAGWPGYELAPVSIADFNGDGTVNRADRMYLARALAKWDGYELK